MQRFGGRILRRVRVPNSLRFAAFSTEPLRTDGSLQKAFMRSVKPAPFKEEARNKNNGAKEGNSSKKGEDPADSKVVIPPVATATPLNPAAEAANVFMKSATATNLQEFAPRICVVGVGGGGCNAINNMVARGLSGVEFICTNTDAQHLSTTLTDKRIQLGRTFTEGLGCGKYLARRRWHRCSYIFF